jgi:hypothetical protein
VYVPVAVAPLVPVIVAVPVVVSVLSAVKFAVAV